jgi:hypothetical protein
MFSFLTGFGAGFALAVLFSPRSGINARCYIAEGLNYLARQTDEVKESALDAVDRSRDALLRHVEKLATMQSPGLEVYHR